VYTGGDDRSSAGIDTFFSDPGTTLTSNTATGNDYGIEVFVSNGAVLKGNVATNGKYGIGVAVYGEGNLFQSNRASGNTVFDCFDESEDGVVDTYNTWRYNRGATSFPASLCNPAGTARVEAAPANPFRRSAAFKAPFRAGGHH